MANEKYIVRLGWHKKDGRVIIVYQVSVPGIDRVFHDAEKMNEFLLGYAAADLKDSNE